MKALTAPFKNEMNKRGTSPINLLEIDLPRPIGRLRLADRDIIMKKDYDTFGSASFSGLSYGGPSLEEVEYRGLVARWPLEIDPLVSRDMTTADIGDLRLTLLNTGKDGREIPFSRYFLSVDPEGAEVRLYQLFLGLPLSQRDLLFKGSLSEPVGYDDSTLSFDVVAGVTKDKVLGQKVTAEEFPAADPADVGKVKPIIYGRLTNFRCLAVGIGAVDQLRADVAVGATVIPLSDVTRFPASGQIQIGSDVIGYTGKDAINHNLTGASGVDAEHKKGDVVWEVRATYDFMVAGHACKSVSEVRINGLLVPSTLYSVDLAGPTLIKFNSHPIGQFISEHLHNVGVTPSGPNTLVQFPIGAPRASWFDGDEGSGDLGAGNDLVTFSDTDFGGSIDAIHYWILHDGNAPASEIRRNSVGGQILGSTSTANAGVKRWQRFTDNQAGRTWTDDLMVRRLGTPSPTIFEIKREVVYVNALAITERGKQVPGLDFWRGAVVTCTVEGKGDDNLGTITGTPNALIERPDHVVKEILIKELGYQELDIDAASFSSSGAEYQNAGYRFAGALVRQEEARALLARLALQARSLFFWNTAGEARLIFRKEAPGVKSILKGGLVKESLKIRHTPASEIVNRINIHFNRDWGNPGIDEEGFANLVTSSDPESINRFGLKEASYFFDFVRDPAMAQNLADFYLSLLARPRVVVELETYLENYDLERGDFFYLTDPDLSLHSHLLEIVEVPHMPGSAKGRRMDRLRIVAEGRMMRHPEVWGEVVWG